MTLIFLKLGGSLITDKTRPYTPRPEKLDLLTAEIAAAVRENPDLQLLLGHGSGSFGHAAASNYQTRLGVSGLNAWHGFAEVWYQASALNRIVVEALHRAGLPAVTLSPSACITSHDGKVVTWNHYPIQAALSNGLLPVIHGDVVFDEVRGGTILSTEDLFSYLAYHLRPQRILLAGLESGVWADFPAHEHLLAEITTGTFAKHSSGLGASVGADVTGGMLAKVTGMLSLVEDIPELKILIFSGEQPGNITRALQGEYPGTLIHC
jgi:isopentenyl phosphate kinase